MRCFIVGNGPSLAVEDLERIKGYYSFGVNRIHLWYDRMTWRPDCWVSDDSWKAVDWDGDFMFHADQGYEIWVRDTMLYDFYNKNDKDRVQPWFWIENLNIYHDCLHQAEYRGHPPPPWHLPHLCSYGWSVYICAQLAVKKGFDEIVFLGCDGFYDGKGRTHMDPRYQERELPGGVMQEYGQDYYDIRNAHMDYGHCRIEKECYKRGIRVLNASRATRIVDHERVTLEEIL